MKMVLLGASSMPVFFFFLVQRKKIYENMFMIYSDSMIYIIASVATYSGSTSFATICLYCPPSQLCGKQINVNNMNLYL